MKVGKIIFGFVILGGLLYGIAYFNRQKKLLASNTYKLKGVRAATSNLSTEHIKVIATITLTNNSDIPFTVWSQRYRGYVNDKQITEITLDKKVVWNPRSSVDVDIPIEFSPKEVFGQILNTGAQTKVMISGNVQVSSGILLVNNFPVNFSFSLSDYIKV